MITSRTSTITRSAQRCTPWPEQPSSYLSQHGFLPEPTRLSPGWNRRIGRIHSLTWATELRKRLPASPMISLVQLATFSVQRFCVVKSNWETDQGFTIIALCVPLSNRAEDFTKQLILIFNLKVSIKGSNPLLTVLEPFCHNSLRSLVRPYSQ